MKVLGMVMPLLTSFTQPNLPGYNKEASSPLVNILNKNGVSSYL